MRARESTIVWIAACLAAHLSCFSAGDGAEYTATSTLRVSWQKPTLLDRDAQTISRDQFQIYKGTQQELLKSRFVLAAALAKPDVAKLAIVRSEADPVRWLSGIIKVKFPGDAEIMTVSCTRENAKEAVILTRAVVDAYLSEVAGAETAWKQERCSLLERIVSAKEQELRRRLETLNQLTAMLTSDDAKAAKKPVPVDIQMLRLDIDILQTVVREVRMELERAKIDLQAPSRVLLIERAYEPLASD